MLPALFASGSPGRLVPTTGFNRVVVDGLQRPRPVQGFAFVPHPLPPKGLDRDRFVGSIFNDIALADRAMTRLDATAASLPNADLLLRPFRRREAQLSSRIENTIATAEQVALVEAGVTKEHDDAWEVWNYTRALEHGLASPLPLCVRLFNEMHAILLQDVRGDDKTPGEFRRVQAHIAGSDERFENARFVPPPPGDLLTKSMNEFEVFLNPQAVDRRRYPSLVETAFAHYQFECIHPYRDGNGRLGRLLIALSLCKDGSINRPVVYVSSFLEKNREEYFELLLRVSTRGEWAEWVRFFCRAVATEAADGLVRARQLTALRSDFVRRVTRPRASALLPKIIDHLFEFPAVRVSTVSNLLDITPQGAQNLVAHLVEAKILHDATARGYDRVYVAREIFAAIEDDVSNQVRPSA